VGCSLTLSFVIDAIHFPCIKKENYAQIAALAVWQLLAGLKIDARFKWPNDIMTERGKICGILAENISDSSVVVGLGVNIALEHESADITKPFTSIHHEIDQVPAVDELTRSLAKCLESAFEECRESGFEHLRDTWKAHDYLQGKTITIRTASDELTGTYAGLSEQGLLLLEVDGETRQFHSGDVTLAAS
jgi:BirA family biotin operon repressor/biotin-[acetyl-CoA-carboxylase] ligase